MGGAPAAACPHGQSPRSGHRLHAPQRGCAALVAVTLVMTLSWRKDRSPLCRNQTSCSFNAALTLLSHVIRNVQRSSNRGALTDAPPSLACTAHRCRRLRDSSGSAVSATWHPRGESRLDWLAAR